MIDYKKKDVVETPQKSRGERVLAVVTEFLIIGFFGAILGAMFFFGATAQ